MKTLSRWISPLTLTPLAVLTLQGLAFDALALTDTNAEVKEVAANHAQAAQVAQAQRPVQTVYVPVTAKQLDGFKPVLPPARALGVAMAQAHTQVKAPAQPPSQMLAKAEATASPSRR